MKSSKNQFALMPKSPLKHWGFIDKLRAPNIEVWQIFLAIKVITYFYPVNYVTYNTLCFILPELPNGTVNLMKKSFLKKYMTTFLYKSKLVINVQT
jgi:hypothetical protein